MELNDRMDFGHVIRVSADGTVTDDWDLHAPESVYQDLDADGQCVDDVVHGLPDSWELLHGFTGQYGYNGPVMHPSEFIGGGLADHILSTPGLYVALIVDGLGPDPDAEHEDYDSIGWAVAYRSTEV